MRKNLSEKKIKSLLILSLKELSDLGESTYSQQLSDELHVQNIQNMICLNGFKGNNYIPKKLRFDVTYCLTLFFFDVQGPIFLLLFVREP